MIELEDCICNAYPNFSFPLAETINEWSILDSNYIFFEHGNGAGSGFAYQYFFGYPMKDSDDMVTDIVGYGKGYGLLVL